MKRTKSDERISFITKDGFSVDLKPFSHSEPKRLVSWRGVLSKPDFLKLLGKVAVKARQLELLKREISSMARELDSESASLAFDSRSGISPRDISSGNGDYWYEIPVDGVDGTAHEVYARYCEEAYRCFPEVRDFV